MKKIVLIGALSFLAACGAGDIEETPAGQMPTLEAQQAIEQLIEEPQLDLQTYDEELEYILVTHFSGETYVPLNPQRLVVFDMGAFDSLDYLGLGYRVVGTPTIDLTPILEQYSDVTNVGTMHEPNLEILVQLDPDLIIIMGRARPMFDELTQIAPTLDFGLRNTHFLEDFRRNNYYLGRIFELEERVEEILSEIDTLIEETASILEDFEKEALIVMYNNGALSAFGPGSRFGGLVHDDLGVPYVDAGIEIIGHGMIISNEYIVDQNPDILFVIDRGAWARSGSVVMDINDFENELVRLTTAYQTGNITYLDSVIWYVAPGGLQGVRSQIEEVREAVLNALY
ncbi:MAG: ABC transporter substrate-binding protein [Defluviitaleaceae bacterium]|nr:ABC transporter substrate-binding protein [Defluviitaleaceae bacterium]